MLEELAPPPPGVNTDQRGGASHSSRKRRSCLEASETAPESRRFLSCSILQLGSDTNLAADVPPQRSPPIMHLADVHTHPRKVFPAACGGVRGGLAADLQRLQTSAANNKLPNKPRVSSLWEQMELIFRTRRIFLPSEGCGQASAGPQVKPPQPPAAPPSALASLTFAQKLRGRASVMEDKVSGAGAPQLRRRRDV